MCMHVTKYVHAMQHTGVNMRVCVCAMFQVCLCTCVCMFVCVLVCAR
jgi:hypothetical protein